MAELPAPPPMVVLRPGDRVLVTMAEDVDGETTQKIATGLKEAFPEVDFTVVTGVASILVGGPYGDVQS